MTRRITIAVGFIAAFLMTDAALADPETPYDFEEKTWTESETAIPSFPKQENLLEFHAGPAERNRFFVDGATISVGTDGIVRYVLVLKTSGGASNVTLEGIRCETREYKLFAVGRSDGTWNKVQHPQWRVIENKLMNRHHAALNRDFLCPDGLAPHDAAAIRAALRRGKQMDAP